MSKLKDLIYLVLSVVAIFIAGLTIVNNKMIGIGLLILGIVFQIYREFKQSYIKGTGVEAITSSKTPPQNPKEGDLWVDLN